MANSKKVKTKLTDDYCDFMNESQFLCDSPKNKKQLKRRANLDVEAPLNRHMNKKSKLNEDIEAHGDTRQKILNVMRKQLDSRKQTNENLTKSLSEIISHLEADYNTHKENEQKIEQLTATITKCMQQVSAAYKQKLKGFKEIQDIFKKELDDMDAAQRAEMEKLGEELDEDFNKLKHKLVSDTKRNERDSLRRFFLQAMQNDL